MATAQNLEFIPVHTIDILHEVRRLFEEQFDRGWAATVIVRSGSDLQNLRELRHLLSEDLEYIGTRRRLDLVRALAQFTGDLRQFVLPGLTEQLRLHLDVPGSWRRREDFVQRRLLAYVFPHNLERLEVLTEELRLG